MADLVEDKRVVIIATLYIEEKGDARQRFIPIFQEFLAHVHSEPGMNHFTVSVNKELTEYGIYEEYKDSDAFKKHKNSQHSADFNEKCKGGENPIFPRDRPPVVSCEYSPFRLPLREVKPSDSS